MKKGLLKVARYLAAQGSYSEAAQLEALAMRDYPDPGEPDRRDWQDVYGEMAAEEDAFRRANTISKEDALQLLNTIGQQEDLEGVVSIIPHNKKVLAAIIQVLAYNCSVSNDEAARQIANSF